MIKFEKISEEQFINDVLELYPHTSVEDIKEAYKNLKLPERGTKRSAGYDIFSPFDFIITEQTGPVVIPTGIKALMPDDMFLMIVPRSGHGFKTGSMLSNTLGIIDADFWEGDTEGHIKLKFKPGFKAFNIEAGNKIAQGIFMEYFITDDDEATGARTGGLGSTGN